MMYFLNVKNEINHIRHIRSEHYRSNDSKRMKNISSIKERRRNTSGQVLDPLMTQTQ